MAVKNKKDGTPKQNPGPKPGLPQKGGYPFTDPFLDPTNMEKLKTLASYGMTVEQISAIFKISRTTMFEIIRRNPDVSQYYREGKSIGIAQVSKSLIQKAMEGDVGCMIFYLKTQAGWKDRTEIIHSGNVVVDVEVVNRIERMTKEQRDLRLAELNKIEGISDAIDVEFDEVK